MPGKPLHFTVVGFENGQAVLKIDSVTIRVLRSQLPDSAKIGDVLSAEFYFAADEKKRKENLAKALLEEILGKE